MKTLRLKHHEFACIDVMPVGVVFDIAEGVEAGEFKGILALRSALYALVVEDEHERLTAALRDPHDPVDFDALNEAVGTLITAYTDRPTERPSSSPDGAESTVRSSRVVSLSPATGRGDVTSSRDGQQAVS